MNKIFDKFGIQLVVSLLFVFGLFVIVQSVSAQANDKYGIQKTQKSTCNSSGDCVLPTKVAGAGSAEELVGSIVNIILSVIGIVFFFLILWAGLNWMTARGNSEKIDKSKETIESAAIGIIVVLAAYAITNFVFSELDKNGSTNSGTSEVACVCKSSCEANTEREVSPPSDVNCGNTQVCCAAQ